MATVVTELRDEAHVPNVGAQFINGPRVSRILQKEVHVHPSDLGRFALAIAILQGTELPEFNWFYSYHFLTPELVDGEVSWWANGVDKAGSLESTFKLFDTIDDARAALQGVRFAAAQVCQVRQIDHDSVAITPVRVFRYDPTKKSYLEYDFRKHQTVMN